MEFSGRIAQHDMGSFVYVPFEVPLAVTSIRVIYEYDNKEEGNALDIGIVESNTRLFTSQFRGWSGGARSEFYVATDSATPGYIAGPIEKGTWNILLGPYKSVDSGINWKVNVTLGFEERDQFAANHAPARSALVSASPLQRVPDKWYRGDLHVHTVYSDGGYVPDEIITLAKERSLNFFFSTEHNTPSANLIWGNHVENVGNFLVGRGEEVTTRHGHWNALGLSFGQWIDFRYHDVIGLEKALKQVHDNDGFAIINHPYDLGLFCDWSFPFLDSFDAIEVWNGPWKAIFADERNEMAVRKWDELLRQGKVFTAVGASDAHRAGNVIGLPQTVVKATDLSTASVIRGMRARNVYIVSDPQYSLNVCLKQGDKSADIGEILDVTDPRVLLDVSLKGFANAKLIIISQEGDVHSEYSVSDNNFSSVIRLNASNMKWIRLEVRDGNGYMLGLTNPIWISISDSRL